MILSGSAPTSSTQFLASFQGSIKWIQATDPTGAIWPSPPYRVSMKERYDADETFMPIYGGMPITWKSQRNCFGVLIATGEVSSHWVSIVLIPYWSVAIPLALLSAFLIVWKPQAKPKDTPDA